METIIQLSKDDLRVLILEIFGESKGTTQTAEKKLIRGINGLSEFLECSPATAQKLKNSGKIPFSQVGRLLLFDSDKVMEAMKSNSKVAKK